MRIVQWEKQRRRLTSSGMRNIYGTPLNEPIIFRFKTGDLNVPPRAGAKSVKLVLQGEETYRFSDRIVRLRPGQFLAVENGETYASEIASETEAVSIFLPGDTAGISAPGGHEANNLSVAAKKSLNSFLAGFQKNNLSSIAKATDQLVRLTFGTRQESEAGAYLLASKTKSATKEALFLRLNDAKTTIDQSQYCFVDVEEMAREAGLSVFYFNRLFREAFGKPPAAYARLNGLSKAAAYISFGGQESSAARRAGYADRRAFRRALIRIYGKSIAEKLQDETTHTC